MENTAAGAITRRGAFCRTVAADLRREPKAAGQAESGRVSVRQPGQFADEEHVWYYASPVRCGRREEETKVVKMRAKLVKRLAVLQAASRGLGVGGPRGSWVEEDDPDGSGRCVLLAQLELLRVEEKEMMKEEEKKAAMRAAAKQMKACDDSEEWEDEPGGNENRL